MVGDGCQGQHLVMGCWEVGLCGESDSGQLMDVGCEVDGVGAGCRVVAGVGWLVM